MTLAVRRSSTRLHGKSTCQIIRKMPDGCGSRYSPVGTSNMISGCPNGSHSCGVPSGACGVVRCGPRAWPRASLTGRWRVAARSAQLARSRLAPWLALGASTRRSRPLASNSVESAGLACARKSAHEIPRQKRSPPEHSSSLCTTRLESPIRIMQTHAPCTIHLWRRIFAVQGPGAPLLIRESIPHTSSARASLANAWGVHVPPPRGRTLQRDHNASLCHTAVCSWATFRLGGVSRLACCGWSGWVKGARPSRVMTHYGSRWGERE